MCEIYHNIVVFWFNLQELLLSIWVLIPQTASFGPHICLSVHDPNELPSPSWKSVSLQNMRRLFPAVSSAKKDWDFSLRNWNPVMSSVQKKSCPQLPTLSIELLIMWFWADWPNSLQKSRIPVSARSSLKIPRLDSAKSCIPFTNWPGGQYSQPPHFPQAK